MEALSRIVREFVMIEGACAAGIATVETLAGGPPSVDLSYVLPGARAAVCFAVPRDDSLIAPYLTKKDRLTWERDTLRANAMSSGIAFHLANYLVQKGYPSVPLAANSVYRPESDGGRYDYIPDIAHRYLAIRSGVGYMGFSGNVITRERGAAIILGATVTTADLVPTDPLPPGGNYCDECRLCLASCVSGYMDSDERTTVSLGKVEFTYSKRRHVGRCDIVCSGYTGLSSSGKWSTWSPGRFAIPDSDDEIPAALERLINNYARWPEAPGGKFFILADGKLRTSCGHCQLVCCPERGEREARFRMLTESGVVLQNRDGSLEAVTPEEAEARLERLPSDEKALYEDPPG